MHQAPCDRLRGAQRELRRPVHVDGRYPRLTSPTTRLVRSASGLRGNYLLDWPDL